MKVERESVTKTRFTVQGDMKNPLISADVVTDNMSEPIALKCEYGKPPITMSVRTAESIVAALSAAIPAAQAIAEKAE